MKIILNYFTVLVPLIILDMVWILLLAKEFYAKHMGFLFSKSINITPVMFFYPLYALGVLFLVVMPAVSSSSWIEALWRGALLGLVAYGAYDLTNHATISGWPTIMTLIDIFWGMTVTSLVSVISYFLITFLK